ncbi:MAG: nucleotidyltransferase family protein [Desulfobacteraceae bacterium]|nr:nucleotidyltransferase family protein [Desulfobacteraceae bacterium]
MKCLILAGGFGTRLGSIGTEKAKALLEFKNKAILTHIVDKIPLNMDIYVTINRRFEADFHQWQKTVKRYVNICVEDAWTEEQKKGAVSSINFWINQAEIDEDLLVIAGDNYFEFNLADFIHACNGKNVLIAVYDIGDRNKASHFGVVSVNRNRIVEFVEKPAAPKSSLIATAIYLFPYRIFPIITQYCSEERKDKLGDFISYLVRTDEVYVYSFNELWLDIGSEIKLV